MCHVQLGIQEMVWLQEATAKPRDRWMSSMKCQSELYLMEDVHLTSVGGKGSNTTPSPKARGHNLGEQPETRGLERSWIQGCGGILHWARAPQAGSRSSLPRALRETSDWGWGED